MKGLGFIAVLVAMVIVALLTIKSLKKKPPSALGEAVGTDVPVQVKALPAYAKERAEEALKKAAERTEKAMKAAE